MAKYRTKELDCWQKAKELRMKYYTDYASAHDRGALRWAGGGWTFDAIPQALEGEVCFLSEEPYGASCGFVKGKATQYQEAAEGKWGCARDVCASLSLPRSQPRSKTATCVAISGKAMSKSGGAPKRTRSGTFSSSASIRTPSMTFDPTDMWPK